MDQNTKTPEPLSAILSGVSGEYFVAAELSRRGYTAALTLKNTRGVDILASRPGGKRSVTIQVKSIKGSGTGWVLSKADESAEADNHFYVFVALNGLGLPSFYLAHSKTVAQQCQANHQAWLGSPKKDGSPRKDTDMRIFTPGTECADRWDLLRLDE